jgi:hypothetical protein
VKYWIMFVGLALLTSLPAQARDKTEHNVTITSPVEVQSTQLEPGHYKVAWEGSGPAVHVEFLQHGKTVATSQAKLVNEGHKSPYDDVVTAKASDGASNLKQIDFQNEEQSLVFGNEPGM